MGRYIGLLVVLSSAVSFLAGAALTIGAGSIAQPRLAAAQPGTASRTDTRPSPVAPAAGTINFADVAERVNPSVVNIEAASRGGERRRFGADDGPDSLREIRRAAPGLGQRLRDRPSGIHPDEFPCHRGRRSDHGDAGGRADAEGGSRRHRPGDRRGAAQGDWSRGRSKPPCSAIPTSCASASGSARSAILSATCTRSRWGWSASSDGSCSTPASTITSRPTPRSISATAADRSSTRAAR